MSRLGETIVTWADRRMDEILASPRMWGSPEAVEMQVLQLLEIRALAVRPEQELENPRRVLESYQAFLRERYPERPADPLFRLVEGLRATEFGEALEEFRGTLTRAILAENPFEHSHLAIQLTFEAGRQPTTSAFTGYYEDFRRAARAAVRGGENAVGRAKKDVEAATDFTLDDAVVTQPNGSPAEVLLRLGAPSGQMSWEADMRVRDALSTIMTLTEWAGSGAAPSELKLDDVDQRTHTALQARRLLPRRGIKTVAWGGRLVSRSKPVEIRADLERRFLEIVGAGTKPESFERRDEIRAIDLDRGLLVLGKDRMHCYVSTQLLEEIAEVGVKARVTGKRYKPRAGRVFVLADEVEPEGAAAAE